VTTRVGSLDGFAYSSFGRYSAIALVATKARRYSTTPLLSTAPSLPSKCLMTDSGLVKNINNRETLTQTEIIHPYKTENKNIPLANYILHPLDSAMLS